MLCEALRIHLCDIGHAKVDLIPVQKINVIPTFGRIV